MKKLGSRQTSGSNALSLAPDEIKQLTPDQLINLSQSQSIIVIVNELKTPYAVEAINEIPDFVGSGLATKQEQEIRPIESLSETPFVQMLNYSMNPLSGHVNDPVRYDADNTMFNSGDVLTVKYGSNVAGTISDNGFGGIVNQILNVPSLALGTYPITISDTHGTVVNFGNFTIN